MPVTFNRRPVLVALASFTADLIANPSPLRANPEWTTQLRPFRIAGNLYYVGSRDLASYLLTDPKGHVLINSNLATSPPQIRASIEKLGFRYQDIKILLISHAHFDHCSGSARILRETGAGYLVMEGDAGVVESGGRSDFHFGRDPSMLYPRAKVTRIVKDGDLIVHGDLRLTALKTAGHTKGCTTWTTTVVENGKPLNAVIVGGPYVLESYNLDDDPKYPEMAADFVQQFRTLQTVPCDLFLGAHGSYYQMLSKYAKITPGKPTPFPNPFIDPSGYKTSVTNWRQEFDAELARQTKAHQARTPRHSG